MCGFCMRCPTCSVSRVPWAIALFLCRRGFLPFCCAALQSSGCQARHACSGAMRDCPDTDSVVLSRQMRLFEHAALSRDVDSCLVPAAGIEVAQPFFCLDRQLCVQYLSFSWFRYFRRADYTEMMGIDAIVPILLSATFIATIGPVLVDKLLDRSGMLRMLFLGRK